MADNFRGTFYQGTTTATSTQYVKAFGSYKSGDHSCVMVLNQDAVSHTYDVSLSGSYYSPAVGAISIRLNSPASGSKTNITIPANATQVVVFDCSGNWVKTIEYTQTNASSYAAPSTTTSGGSFTPPISITLNSLSPSNCSSNTGAIDIAVTGGTGSYTYSWSPGGATTQDISGVAPNDYTVSVTSGTCTTAVTSKFSVMKKSAAVTVSPLSDSGHPSTFTASGAASYSWSPSTYLNTTTGSSVTCTQTDNRYIQTYTVTGTDGTTGCTNTATATHYAVDAGNDVNLASCCTATLTASNINNATYQWYKLILGTYVSLSGATNRTFNPSGLGTFKVVATITLADDCNDSTATVSDIVVVYSDGTASPPCCSELAPMMTRAGSFEQPVLLNFVLYPNPASDRAVISIPTEVVAPAATIDIEITDPEGRLIQRIQTSNQENIEINTSQLDNGIYFVTLYIDGDQGPTKKMISNK
jgi:hypothetical protein